MQVKYSSQLSMILLTGFSLISSLTWSSASPSDVVGRDLDFFPLGRVGHVRIITANLFTDPGSYVVEALNEPLVLQINTLSNFKKRTPYWGAKYGLINNSTAGTKVINEGAFQTSLKCAEYTATISWKAGTGQWGVPRSCPMFRCDTFVNYLYWWGGVQLPTYNPSGTYGKATLPALVFNSIPYRRNESYKGLTPPSLDVDIINSCYAH